MKTPRFYHSLYFKLAALFLCSVLILAAIEIYFSTRNTRKFIAEIHQSIEWDVASSIANQIQPHILNAVTHEKFNELIYPFSLANPKLEFYLLENDGSIFSHAPPSGIAKPAVNLEPIRKALSTYTPSLPLLGDDPSGRKIIRGFLAFDSDQNTFSVAPIRFNGTDGYLYIIIEGKPFTRRIRMLGQFFLSRLLSLGGVFVALGTILLSYLLFGTLTKKFRVITQSVERFERGDYSEPLAVKSSDEIGVLSRALNSMAEKLIVAKAEIEERDRSRRKLIARISHDLRTPLSSIYGYLELCLENSELDKLPQLKCDIERAFEGAKFQTSLVDDLFELSKLEAKDRTPDIDAFDIDELIQEVVKASQLKADKKNIKIYRESNGATALALGDRLLIARVLTNLLENALRFTPESGEIGLSSSYQDRHLIVSILDTGPGVMQGDEKKIVEEFSQTDVKENDKHQGAGLGLAIVQRILELHNTELEISGNEGNGSRFSFKLKVEK